MKIITKNKKVYFDYEIIDTWDAGIVLVGYEVKTIKTQKCNISEAIIKIDGKEVWIVGMDIPLYKKTAPQLVSDYNPKRRRKLLLTKKQIGKLRSQVQKTGLQIVPLEVYLDKHRRIKLKIGLARRKKKIEKRSLIKERDIKRQMDKEMREFKR